MVKYLSFDVGIKNLSYCIIDDETLKIEEWGLINVLKNDIKKRPKCSLCSSDKYYAYNYVELPKRLDLCKKHTKKYEKVSIKEIEECYKEGVEGKCIKCKKKSKVCINETNYCTTHYNQKNKIKQIKIKKVNCSTMNIKDILLNTINILDDEYNHFLKCDNVIIEQQPCKKLKMQSVSNNLFTYFLIRGVLCKESNIKDVEYISATRKLYIYPKVYKKTYQLRKKLSIFITNKYINENNEKEEVINLFNKTKKKDDLSDALLQCLSYLNHLPLINYNEIELN